MHRCVHEACASTQKKALALALQHTESLRCLPCSGSMLSEAEFRIRNYVRVHVRVERFAARTNTYIHTYIWHAYTHAAVRDCGKNLYDTPKEEVSTCMECTHTHAHAHITAVQRGVGNLLRGPFRGGGGDDHRRMLPRTNHGK